VSDPQQAERVLGGTAQLEFRQQPGTEAQLFVEQQVRQELQKAGQLRKLVTRQRLKNQEALKRSNGAIADLFESKGLTRKTSKMPLVTQASNNWNVAIRFDTRGRTICRSNEEPRWNRTQHWHLLG